LWDVTVATPGADPIVLAGHELGVTSMTFSPDGRWLAAASVYNATASWDNTVRLWDVTAADPGADHFVLAGHEGSAWSVAFSPDGRWLATASGDKTVRLWNVTAADPGANPIVLAGHEGSAWSVTFSPDGRWLATTSVDKTARLWDVTGADPGADPIVGRT
jgi:WD40 repeat protein